MNNIDLSHEALQKRRKIAEKAKFFVDSKGRIDTRSLYFTLTHIDDVWFIIITDCAVDDLTKPDTPHYTKDQFGALYNFIRAVDPVSVPAMIDEIESLRKKLNDCKSKLGNARVRNANLSRDNDNLRLHLNMCEKECDWLAQQAATCAYCRKQCYDNATDWRKAAREAVEGKE